MPIEIPLRQKLRTKTGCLVCRSRRKKCDEQTPVCGRCALSGRNCQWPTSEDLLDRRYASHQKLRCLTIAKHQQLSHPISTPDKPKICLLSASVAHRVVIGDMEVAISRHFIDQYYGLLLLPNCHSDFYNGWIDEIQVLMTEYKSLYYSVLANAASHLHFIEGSGKLQELALTYYSKALRGLSSLLASSDHLENHNGILMSVMLLYLHGCMGRGTYLDIPRHLNAATRVLSMRLFGPSFTMRNPFDRLAVESVLYQIFLVSTGLWSDDCPLDYDFDASFWHRAEQLLDQSIMFPGQSNCLNTPVLGVPVALYRLAITLKQMCQSPSAPETSALNKARSEVEVWEGFVLCDRELETLPANEKVNDKHAYYKDASYLFILIVSLLLEQIPESSTNDSPESGDRQMPKRYPPRMASSDSWQIRKAVQILRKYYEDDEWKRCFIGNWPVYSIGYFVSTNEDVALIHRELIKRWNLTKFNQNARFCNDLEHTWILRGLISSRGTGPWAANASLEGQAWLDPQLALGATVNS